MIFFNCGKTREILFTAVLSKLRILAFVQPKVKIYILVDNKPKALQYVLVYIVGIKYSLYNLCIQVDNITTYFLN